LQKYASYGMNLEEQTKWYKNLINQKNKPKPSESLKELLRNVWNAEDFRTIFLNLAAPICKDLQPEIERILFSKKDESLDEKPNILIAVWIAKLRQLKNIKPNFEAEINHQIEVLNWIANNLKDICVTQKPELSLKRYKALENLARINPKIIIVTGVKNNLTGIKKIFNQLAILRNKHEICWVVVDNFSTDETANFLQNLQKKEPWVILVNTNKATGYPVYARNFLYKFIFSAVFYKAILPTTWIGRMDSDDEFDLEGVSQIITKLNRLDKNVKQLVAKSIIQKKDRKGQIVSKTLYPTNLNGQNHPEIYKPYEILEAGIADLSSFTQAEEYIKISLPQIPTIEDAWTRALFEIIPNSGGKIKFIDDLLYGYKNETSINHASKMKQIGNQNEQEEIGLGINLGNYSFSGLQSLYFKIILEITNQQHNGDLYR